MRNGLQVVRYELAILSRHNLPNGSGVDLSRLGALYHEGGPLYKVFVPASEIELEITAEQLAAYNENSSFGQCNETPTPRAHRRQRAALFRASG